MTANPQNLTLFNLIGYIESKNVPTAIRFEHGVYAPLNARPLRDAEKDILNRIKVKNNCSYYTAKMLYSSSFGETQIMGFNLWSNVCDNFDGTYFDFLSSHDAQILAFNNFCANKHILVTPADLSANQELRRKFAVTYNGSHAYTVGLENALKHFNFPLIKNRIL